MPHPLLPHLPRGPPGRVRRARAGLRLGRAVRGWQPAAPRGPGPAPSSSSFLRAGPHLPGGCQAGPGRGSRPRQAGPGPGPPPQAPGPGVLAPSASRVSPGVGGASPPQVPDPTPGLGPLLPAPGEGQPLSGAMVGAHTGARGRPAQLRPPGAHRVKAQAPPSRPDRPPPPQVCL